MYQIDFNKPVKVFFCGIGGISMSGLAEILKSRGFEVSGSDRAPSAVTRRLEAKGIPVAYGQKEENITEDLDLVVFTAAIHPDNPEYVKTMKLGLNHLTRAQLLGEIMRNYPVPVAIAGTHGKTTTTSMISEILLHSDDDPTISVGGMLKSIGGQVRVGHSPYFVAEACEYTNSFLSLYPKIGIILDVDADHLDFFKDLSDIRRSFRRFAQLIPEDGTLIINSDIPDVQEITAGLACRVVYYGSDSISAMMNTRTRRTPPAAKRTALSERRRSRSAFPVNTTYTTRLPRLPRPMFFTQTELSRERRFSVLKARTDASSIKATGTASRSLTITRITRQKLKQRLPRRPICRTGKSTAFSSRIPIRVQKRLWMILQRRSALQTLSFSRIFMPPERRTRWASAPERSRKRSGHSDIRRRIIFPLLPRSKILSVKIAKRVTC